MNAMTNETTPTEDTNAEDNAPDTVTRTMKFEVIFPGWRSKDLFGTSKKQKRAAKKAAKEPPVEQTIPAEQDAGQQDPSQPPTAPTKTKPTGLAHDLWGAMSDLTTASNKAISALWLLKQGNLPWPLYPLGHKKAGQKVIFRSLVYQCFSGAWQPWGEPLYVAKRGPQVAGNALLDAAGRVHTRIKTDYKDITMGKKSMSTFRQVPVGVVGASVSFGAADAVTLQIWGKDTQRKTVTVRPRKLDGGQLAILRHCAAGTYKHGNAALIWHQPIGRKGKWMLTLAWTKVSSATLGLDVVGQGGGSQAQDGQANRASRVELIAGVHLGMLSTASVAYIKHDGEVLRKKDILDLANSAVRAYERMFQEKRQRSNTNRNELHLREGRGRQRKLRVVEAFGEKGSRIVDTAVKQLAALVVSAAQRKGATTLAIEALTHWSVATALDELPLGTNRQRAAHRRWYFRWHQGALRQAIHDAAELAGLTVLSVGAENDSRTCNKCGMLWARTGVYAPPPKRQGKKKGVAASSAPLGTGSATPGPASGTGPVWGRVTWNEWKCSCGEKCHADRNAAINVAKRGLAAWQTAQAAK
jgi:hypothetical protein